MAAAAASAPYYSTYEDGPRFYLTKSITQKEYMAICRELSAALKEVTGEDIKIMPEPITEGGFMFTNAGYMRASETKKYKTMRHHLITPDNRVKGFPWISEETPKQWESSDELLWPAGHTIRTVLKAFYGAPAWNKKEIDAFKTVFAKYGIKEAK
jgi:hypothetical protein